MNPRNTFYLCLALIALWLGLVAYGWDDGCRKLDASIVSNNSEEQKETLQHRIFVENDSYYWLGFAREMVTNGKWRIHFTHADNAPYGREVHWSQSVSWLIVLFGWIVHLGGIADWTIALETGSVWINPLLHILLILGTSFALKERFGVVPAILMAFLLATLPDIAWDFLALRPDHQTLHLAFALGSFIALLVSGLAWTAEAKKEQNKKWQWLREPSPPSSIQAKRGFFIAGILTGAGLWIGATPQLFVLGSITIASLILSFSLPIEKEIKKGKSVWKYTPELWRSWGWTAAAVSFFFYMLEYAPNNFHLRLEVNNPFYSLLAGCCGEFLAALGAWQILGQPIKGRLAFKIGFFLALCCGIASLILFGPETWYQIKNPYMLRFHKLIHEFDAFIPFAEGHALTTFFEKLGVIPLGCFGLIALLVSRTWNGFLVSLIGFPTLIALAFGTAMYNQVRWSGLAASFIALAGILFFVVLYFSGTPSWRSLATPWAVIIVGNIAFFGWQQNKDIQKLYDPHQIVTSVGQMILFKHLALCMKTTLNGQEARILAEPNVVPTLHYFTGIPCVTSYYWENLDGLMAATEIFTDEKGTVAEKIALDRGLTHILTTRGSFVARSYYFVKTGNGSDPDAKFSLLGKLCTGLMAYSWITHAPEQDIIDSRRYNFHGSEVQHQFELFKLSPKAQ